MSRTPQVLSRTRINLLQIINNRMEWLAWDSRIRHGLDSDWHHNCILTGEGLNEGSGPIYRGSPNRREEGLGGVTYSQIKLLGILVF